jgi:oligopeptide/dipeptide ABC transporter ATP-binding protein
LFLEPGNLLAVEDLETYFYLEAGILKAVDGISFRIGTGQAVALVGESGSGKSVTALSILRLVPRPGKTIGGRILYKGSDLCNLTESEMRRVRGARISMVFQNPMTYLNPVLRIEDQIVETLKLHQNVQKGVAQRMAIEALDEVRIPSPSRIIKNYPHQLSGGMSQRVLIAIAMACRPDLLIADEPTTALDVTVQAQILELLKRLKEKSTTSFLLITHDLGIVADLCDEVNIMYAGKIVEHADVFTVFEKPRHPYTLGLLKSTMSIKEPKSTLATVEGAVPDLINPPSGCRFHPRCGSATALCRREEPPLVTVEPGHVVSCWICAPNGSA